MEGLFIFFLLVLLVSVHGIEDYTHSNHIFMPGEFESWNDYSEEGGGDEVVDEATFGMLRWASDGGGRILVNVDSFGAVGDGISDDTQAFRDAWDKACSIKKAVFLVPEGRTYLVNATRFKGPCTERLIVQIGGTVVAPSEPQIWDPKNPRVWLYFSRLDKVTFQGGGVLSGSGAKWWESSCKKNKSNPCRTAPSAFTIDLSSRVRVRNLHVKDSQQMHFVISRSESVKISGLRIEAPGDSPNTDGIHISESTNVALINCKIATGDDCISISNATSNIKMKNIDCGPGHGISIGSLGKDNSTAAVTAIVLDTAILRQTMNGLRIKTWQGGSGYARAIRFENVQMINVANPIIIDQFYCDSPTPCQNLTSAVKVSQVLYKNVSGTSKTPKAMKFACSDTVPCSNIVLDNINLERENGTAETYCNCATGFHIGTVQPSAECLQEATCDGTKVLIRREPTNFIHTEL